MNDLPPSYDEVVSVYPSRLLVRELLRVPSVSLSHPLPSASQRSCLIVYKFAEECGGQSFLKVGNWVHPLIPGETRFLLSRKGGLCLSTPFGDHGDRVSLWIDGIPPAYAYALGRLLLDIGVGHGLPTDENQNQRNEETSSQQTARTSNGRENRPSALIFGIRFLTGMFALVKNVVWIPMLSRPFRTFGLIAIAGPSAPVAEVMKNGMVQTWRVVRVAGHAAAHATVTAASAVGGATMCVARTVAPHVERGGVKLVTLATGQEAEDAESTVDSVKGAASLAMEKLEKVYVSVADALRYLGHTAKSNLSSFASSEIAAVAGLAASTSYNVGFLTPSGALARDPSFVTGRVEAGRNRLYPTVAAWDSSVADAGCHDFTPSAPPLETNADDVRDVEEFEFLDPEKWLVSFGTT